MKEDDMLEFNYKKPVPAPKFQKRSDLMGLYCSKCCKQTSHKRVMTTLGGYWRCRNCHFCIRQSP